MFKITYYKCMLNAVISKTHKEQNMDDWNSNKKMAIL